MASASLYFTTDYFMPARACSLCRAYTCTLVRVRFTAPYPRIRCRTVGPLDTATSPPHVALLGQPSTRPLLSVGSLELEAMSLKLRVYLQLP